VHVRRAIGRFRASKDKADVSAEVPACRDGGGFGVSRGREENWLKERNIKASNVPRLLGFGIAWGKEPNGYRDIDAARDALNF
jgi:hypothetical protein